MSFFPSVLLQGCGVGGRKGRFALLDGPRTQHREFAINVGFSDIHSRLRVRVQKLGTVRSKYHIPAADSASVCYFIQVNSK